MIREWQSKKVFFFFFFFFIILRELVHILFITKLHLVVKDSNAILAIQNKEEVWFKIEVYLQSQDKVIS